MGRNFPRWTLLAAGWAGSAILVLYGGVFVATGLLVETGVVVPDGAVDWWALRWHIWLWDMWFLLWGVALAIATWQFARRSSAP